MARQTEERDVYRIPENFVDTGTVMGGMFKLRNVLEAGAIAAVFILPLFKINISLTAKIIIACLTALPLGLLALIGVNGESLSSFILGFFKFLQNKRVIGKGGTVKPKPEPMQVKPKKSKVHREESVDRYDDFDDEFHDDFSRPKKERPVRRTFDDEPREKKKTIEFPKPTSPVAQYLPIEDIRNGIIYTRDHRYVKIIEVSPINFLLRSAREQRNIIYSFVSYLKISPAKIQFKVLTKKADVNRHLYKIEEEIAHETDEKCRVLQQDYANLVRQLGSKEAITRRFFLIFEYEGIGGRRGDEKDAIAELNSVVQTATVFLRQCGNEVIQYENDNDFTVDVLYNLLNRNTAIDKTIEEHIADLMTRHGGVEQLPVGDIIAPDSIDVTHGSYVIMDRMYHAYLLIPSDGYKSQVSAGWLSLLVNAGEGIDLDIFIARQPKEQMVRKIGQQLRINRSKIKDTSDTNTDFDDLDDAIKSGYYLKDGLGNNEDLYLMNILITVTADSAKELEWRIDELKKLLISQDMMGHDLDLALTMMKSEGGKQDQYFRIDEMTDSMCYIPITMEGDFLLRMNFLSNSMQRLKYSILQKMNLQPCPNSLDCDGYEDPKTAILFACDMDLKRIRNLKIGAEHKLLNLIILCFDFQADLLRNYYGDNAMIRTIDARKTAELFKIPFGGGAS